MLLKPKPFSINNNQPNTYLKLFKYKLNNGCFKKDSNISTEDIYRKTKQYYPQIYKGNDNFKNITTNLPIKIFNLTTTTSLTINQKKNCKDFYNYQQFNCVRRFSTIGGIPLKKKKMAKLTEQERKEQLQPLIDSGWSIVNNRDAIYKEYIFKNFNEAFSFMTSIALLADKIDHHPEWFNVYNKVQITMSTHDVSGLSAKDLKMANFMEQQSKKYF